MNQPRTKASKRDQRHRRIKRMAEATGIKVQWDGETNSYMVDPGQLEELLMVKTFVDQQNNSLICDGIGPDPEGPNYRMDRAREMVAAMRGRGEDPAISIAAWYKKGLITQAELIAGKRAIREEEANG